MIVEVHGMMTHGTVEVHGMMTHGTVKVHGTIGMTMIIVIAEQVIVVWGVLH